jgi:hypothetical protein
MPVEPVRGSERGRVNAIQDRRAGVVQVEVEGEPCVAYPRLTGPVALGDEVLAAARPSAGSADRVLCANLSRPGGGKIDPAELERVLAEFEKSANS